MDIPLKDAASSPGKFLPWSFAALTLVWAKNHEIASSTFWRGLVLNLRPKCLQITMLSTFQILASARIHGKMFPKSSLISFSGIFHYRTLLISFQFNNCFYRDRSILRFQYLNTHKRVTLCSTPMLLTTTCIRLFPFPIVSGCFHLSYDWTSLYD